MTNVARAPKRLPNRPSLRQLRKQARDLQKAVGSDDADVLRRVHASHPRPPTEAEPSGFSLSQAMLVVAREHGFASWPRLKAQVEAASSATPPPNEPTPLPGAIAGALVDSARKAARASGPQALPMLPLRDVVVFPGDAQPLFIGRAKSINALDRSAAGAPIALCPQVDPGVADPTITDLGEFLTIGVLTAMLVLPDGTRKVMVEGQRRARLVELSDDPECWSVVAEPVDDPPGEFSKASLQRLRRQADVFMRLYFPAAVSASETGGSVRVQRLPDLDGDPNRLLDQVAARLPGLATRRELLQPLAPAERMARVIDALDRAIKSASGEA